MATFSKRLLSGSTDGKGIDVVATAIASGTTLHTAQSGSLLDLITLFVANTHTADVVLTLGWGGTADPDILRMSIPFDAGLVLAVADLPLTNGLLVRASGSVASVLQVYGYVNRIT